MRRAQKFIDEADEKEEKERKWGAKKGKLPPDQAREHMWLVSRERGPDEASFVPNLRMLLVPSSKTTPSSAESKSSGSSLRSCCAKHTKRPVPHDRGRGKV